MSGFWFISPHADPTYFVMRMHLCPAGIVPLTYLSRLLCMCSFWRRSMMFLNSLLKHTSRGCTTLVQPGGTRTSDVCVSRLSVFLTLCCLRFVHICDQEFRSVSIWTKGLFPHVAAPVHYLLLIAPSVRLKPDHHSVIVCPCLSLRNSESFAAEDQQWLDSRYTISKDGQLNSTLALV